MLAIQARVYLMNLFNKLLTHLLSRVVEGNQKRNKIEHTGCQHYMAYRNPTFLCNSQFWADLVVRIPLLSAVSTSYLSKWTEQGLETQLGDLKIKCNTLYVHVFPLAASDDF